MKDLHDIPINVPFFSRRVVNICLMNEIRTIYDLTNYKRSDFSNLRNSGVKCCNEVEAFLQSKGFSWKLEDRRKKRT